MVRKSNTKINMINALIGYGIAMLLDLVSAVMVSIFIQYEYFDLNQIQPAVFITHLIASFGGTLFLLKRVGEKKIIYASTIAIAYYITQIITSMLLFSGLNSDIIMGIIPISGGTIGAVLLDKKPKKRARRRRNR